MGGLSLAVLGQPQVRHGSAAISFPTRKALALLVYLALEGGAHSREKITTLFWPDSDTPAGRSTLRKTLAFLQKALREPGAAHLLAERDALAVERSGAALDVWEIQSVLEDPRATLPSLQAAAALCR